MSRRCACYYLVSFSIFHGQLLVIETINEIFFDETKESVPRLLLV